MENFFKDKNGRIVLFQTPNSPLIGWFICWVLTLLSSYIYPQVQHFFNILSFGFIFTWAWLEIISGVNYFRRLLGLVVLLLAVWFQVG